MLTKSTLRIATTTSTIRTNHLKRRDGPLPGLIIHNLEDEVIGIDSAEAIAASWQSAELVPTTGLGHSRTLRDPAVIDQIVTFISAKPISAELPARSSA